MKNIFFLFCHLTIVGYGQGPNQEILRKTIAELNKIEDVLYTSTFTASEKGVVYSETQDTIFFDFLNKAEAKPPKYFISTNETKLIYNGQQHIQATYKDRIIVTNDSPDPLNPLLLTLYPIKALLPKMIDNANVLMVRKNDTIISGKKNYVIDVTVKDGRLDWNRLDITKVMTLDSKYTLWIDKSSYLPSKVSMKNGSGTISRTMDNIVLNYEVDENLWDGRFLPSDYKKISIAEYITILESRRPSKSKGKIATSDHLDNNIGKWALPTIKDDLKVHLSGLKGNVVMLEFWFKFCGPCVQAVPRLNALNDTFKDKNFKFYGVEFRENFSRENLLEYAEKINISYPLLYAGGNLASIYEVSAAPTFIIFDKSGNVVYHKSGFNEEELIKTIKDNL
jgi:thiol-disulfide isomerase/thioredoxin